MPRRRTRTNKENHSKTVPFIYSTFILEYGKESKEKSENGIRAIAHRTETEYKINYETEKKEFYEVTFTSPWIYNIELAYAQLLGEIVINNYNNRANETCKKCIINNYHPINNLESVQNLLDKMRLIVDNTYRGFKNNSREHNNIAFSEMLQKFTFFAGKFVKVSNFSFSYYEEFGYLINAITDINFIKKYSICHINELNKVIDQFNESIVNTPLSL